MRRVLTTIAAALAITSLPAKAANLCVIGWNLESGDSDTATLAKTVLKYADCDIWGLSEVADNKVSETLELSAESQTRPQFNTVLGTTGRSDAMAIMYDTRRLRLLDVKELRHLQEERGRAPLVGLFELKETGDRFYFMVNHLYRGNRKDNRGKRLRQSEGLNIWAAEAAHPVIAVGDYNYDWDLPNGASHDKGFDALLDDGVFAWVEPAAKIRTQCSDPGQTQYNSILDFVFVSGAAQNWQGKSDILEAQASWCPDNAMRSDHRPVRANFTLQ